MSVAIQWDPTVVRSPEGAALRPVLTLVPPLPVSIRPVTTVPGAARIPRVSTWRLTRRGRLMRTLAIFTALAFCVLLRWGPALGAPTGLPDREVTVRAGQSLSDVAVQELPGLPATEAVRRLRVHNNLVNASVYEGQILRVPDSAP